MKVKGHPLRAQTLNCWLWYEVSNKERSICKEKTTGQNDFFQVNLVSAVTESHMLMWQLTALHLADQRSGILKY